MWTHYIRSDVCKMTNVTITVPEELRIKMDNYSEVSWSEICRNAISQYIAQRENPTPRLELDVRSPRIDHYDSETGYATLIVDLRIQNRMSSEIILNRVLATGSAETPNGLNVYFGQTYDLHKKTITPNSVGSATIRLPFPREKLLEFKDKFTRTFNSRLFCRVFVDGFRDDYTQEVIVQIPIDVWNSVIEKALKRGQEKQATQ